MSLPTGPATAEPVRRVGEAADYAVDHTAGVIAYGSVSHAVVDPVGDPVADVALQVREEPSR